MEIIKEMLTSWEGILSLATAIVMFVAIPVGVGIALHRQIKGPMEIRNESQQG